MAPALAHDDPHPQAAAAAAAAAAGGADDGSRGATDGSGNCDVPLHASSQAEEEEEGQGERGEEEAVLVMPAIDLIDKGLTYVIPCASHVTRHTSHVTRHTSHVTRHTP
jgi:hypothetical protein